MVRLGVPASPKNAPKSPPPVLSLPLPHPDPKLSLYAHVRLGGGCENLGGDCENLGAGKGREGHPPRLRLVVTQGELALALPQISEP